jgi:hypothetical protein
LPDCSEARGLVLWPWSQAATEGLPTMSSGESCRGFVASLSEIPSPPFKPQDAQLWCSLPHDTLRIARIATLWQLGQSKTYGAGSELTPHGCRKSICRSGGATWRNSE